MGTFGFDPQEVERLELLVRFSTEEYRKTAQDFNKTQFEGATESTQFFEKLAIGSGAAITALVSFLGANHAPLTPTLDS